MTNISTELAFQIRQNGAQELSQSLIGIKGQIEGVSDATIKHSAATSKLTQFIREERTEHRQQNFLFRESRDSIMLVASAMLLLNNNSDSGNETAKKINRTMQEGVGAFMAADFAIKGLGLATGGTAVAISAAIGAGVGLLSFFDNSKEKAEAAKLAIEGYNQSAKEMSEGIGLTEARRELEIFDKQLAANKKAIDAAKSLVLPTQKTNPWEQATVDNKALVDLELRQEALQRYRNSLVGVVAIEEQRDLVKKREAGSPEAQYEEQVKAMEYLLDLEQEAREKKKQRMMEYEKVAVDNENHNRDVAIQKEQVVLDVQEAQVKSAQKLARQEERAMRDFTEGINSASQAFAMLGVQSDSTLGRMISGLQTVLEIMRAIKLLSAAAGFLGIGASPESIVDLAGVKLPLPDLTPVEGSVTPDKRGKLMKVISDAQRKGY